MVLRYTGESTEFRGCVLRLRKGVKNDEAKRQIEEDSQFQRLVLQPILAPYHPYGTILVGLGLGSRNCDVTLFLCLFPAISGLIFLDCFSWSNPRMATSNPVHLLNWMKT